MPVQVHGFHSGLVALVSLLVVALPGAQTVSGPGWWMTEPVRFLQTNISENDTAYFAPVEMRDIRIELPRTVRRAHAVSLGRDLEIQQTNSSSSFTLPTLGAYEVIAIE